MALSSFFPGGIDSLVHECEAFVTKGERPLEPFTGRQTPPTVRPSPHSRLRGGGEMKARRIRVSGVLAVLASLATKQSLPGIVARLQHGGRDD